MYPATSIKFIPSLTVLQSFVLLNFHVANLDSSFESFKSSHCGSPNICRLDDILLFGGLSSMSLFLFAKIDMVGSDHFFICVALEPLTKMHNKIKAFYNLQSLFLF